MYDWNIVDCYVKQSIQLASRYQFVKVPKGKQHDIPNEKGSKVFDVNSKIITGMYVMY